VEIGTTHLPDGEAEGGELVPRYLHPTGGHFYARRHAPFNNICITIVGSDDVVILGEVGSSLETLKQSRMFGYKRVLRGVPKAATLSVR